MPIETFLVSRFGRGSLDSYQAGTGPPSRPLGRDDVSQVKSRPRTPIVRRPEREYRQNEDTGMTPPFPLLAAVRYRRDDAIDGLLEAVARDLRARGARVAGYVQRETEASDECCAITYLEDLATGEHHVISQSLGGGAKGCRLDPQALAGLCGLLEAALARGADILVLNRFGKGEAEGHGLRAAIGQAMLADVPVLTAVQDAWLPAWQAFAGEFGTTLSPTREAIDAWAGAALAALKETA